MEDDIQKAEETEQNTKKRIDWIDFAKGVSIILVIFGHCMIEGRTELLLKSVIFSFHMPLFFILSAVTFKLSTNNDQFISKTERAFRHLIIPVLIMYTLRTAINIHDMQNMNWTNFFNIFLAENINILTYASGVSVKIQGIEISYLGATWFCVALFFGRSIFDYLHLKINNKTLFITIITVCAISGIYIGSKVQSLPLSLDIALACMPLFYFGYCLQNYDITKKIKVITTTSLIIWIFGLFISYYCVPYIGEKHLFYLDFAERVYPLFPLFYIIAIVATMFISSCGVISTNKLPNLVQPLLCIGKNSLYLLCIHDTDYLWKDIWE
ncbi:acyltransferase family protein, partial [bacterium]|nr:acyltransferase family protein [bacterium]